MDHSKGCIDYGKCPKCGRLCDFTKRISTGYNVYYCSHCGLMFSQIDDICNDDHQKVYA